MIRLRTETTHRGETTAATTTTRCFWARRKWNKFAGSRFTGSMI